ncbi:hypothetical protein Pfo_029211 [Paulownia fortunei]|nr:hypothetical protein Pfo_029211 [Paulownia fortunei]
MGKSDMKAVNLDDPEQNIGNADNYAEINEHLRNMIRKQNRAGILNQRGLIMPRKITLSRKRTQEWQKERQNNQAQENLSWNLPDKTASEAQMYESVLDKQMWSEDSGYPSLQLGQNADIELLTSTDSIYTGTTKMQEKSERVEKNQKLDTPGTSTKSLRDISAKENLIQQHRKTKRKKGRTRTSPSPQSLLDSRDDPD